jgi:Glycerol uptake facilitator and related permeases (Major Intrinsic Protein Family)
MMKRLGAEFIGTYALVTAGCGAIVTDNLTGALTHIGVAITFGLIITVMIAASGHISGAHFNPAVTIAFALTRHFAWRDVPAYVAAQLLGGIAGALTLRLLFGPVANLGATMPSGDVWQSFGVELLLTVVLICVIVAVATDTRAGDWRGTWRARLPVDTLAQ